MTPDCIECSGDTVHSKINGEDYMCVHCGVQFTDDDVRD
jgi:DNA-directed RNA polymerase subunit RPC12/RpoP